MSFSLPSLAAPLWFVAESGVEQKRRYRDYAVLDVEGRPLLAARTFLMKRDIPVRAAGEPSSPVMLLRRRRSFPVTGKYDLLSPDGSARLGLLSRSGRFRSTDGTVTGRFRDARTLRDHLGESAFELAGQILVGSGDSSAAGSGPDGFVLLCDGQPAGTLVLQRLPFTEVPAPPAHRGTVARTLGRWVPGRLKALAEAMTAKRGWKLEVADPDRFPDVRLPIAAALLTAEISRW